MGLVDKWLGSLPAKAELYRDRLKKLDAEIAKRRSTRKGLLLSKIQAIFDEVLREGTGGGIDEDVLAEIKQVFQQRDAALVAERDQVAALLRDAEAQQGRVDEVLATIEKRPFGMESFTPERRRDLLDLLGVRVQVVGGEQRSRKGAVDPLTEWHRESGTLVPLTLSDDAWAVVEPLLPMGRSKLDHRASVGVILHKLRTATRWADIEVPGGGAWMNLYRLATRWHKDGHREAAIRALKDEGGVPVPGHGLPAMLLTSAFSPVPEIEAGKRNGSEVQAQPV
jgi:hypothetical protein